jgi:tRNA1Val (adenine37-N6)-methyltransferase
MANHIFRFKQFEIEQNNCAMKVGTDGILLGAWTKVPEQGRILDIGTGTGLLSLMVAQRSNCMIDAIEIDLDAAQQAKSNIRNSKWSKRISVFHNSLKDYVMTSKGKYDIIISNPPFYISNLKSQDEKKNRARNAESLPLFELVQSSIQLLKESGALNVIIPYEHVQRYMNVLAEYNMDISRMTTVKGNERKSPSRVLIEVKRSCEFVAEQMEIIIMNTTDNNYTAEYRNLTRNYYLKFR